MSKEDINLAEMYPYPSDITKVRVPIPGIQILHSRSSEEIGEVLSDLIHSQTNLVEIKFVIGKYIELTINNTPPDNIVFKQIY